MISAKQNKFGDLKYETEKVVTQCWPPGIFVRKKALGLTGGGPPYGARLCSFCLKHLERRDQTIMSTATTTSVAGVKKVKKITKHSKKVDKDTPVTPTDSCNHDENENGNSLNGRY